jgi:hypothetical protein
MVGLVSKRACRSYILLLSVPLVVVGCGDFEDGAEDSGSLFNVEYIDPTYFGESTRQVDVFQGNCAEPGEPPDDEQYGDHWADVTLSNRPLNNAVEQTASTIYLDGYELVYQPVSQGSPSLPSTDLIPIGEGVGLEPCAPFGECEGETLPQIYFVTVREKEILRQYIGSSGLIQLKYNVYYVFYGENDYGYEVRATGVSNFVASNYDYCD